MNRISPDLTEVRRRRTAQTVLVRTGNLIADREEMLNRMDPEGRFGTEMVGALRAADDALADLPGDASSGEILRIAGHEIAANTSCLHGRVFGVVLETLGSTLGNGPNDIFTVLRAHQMALRAAQSELPPTDQQVSLLSVLEPFVTGLGKAARSGVTLNRGWQLALGDAELAGDELAQTNTETADACIMLFLLRSTAEVLESTLPDYI